METPEKKKPSFEEALSELEALVKSLESGKIKLEEAIDGYERGIALKKICEEKLKDAKMKIDRLEAGDGGVITGAKPFGDES